MKKFALVVLIAVISVAINWLALVAGWWWITPATGLLIGLFLRPAGIGFLASLCAGALGWGLPLALLALNAPVKSVASAVESVVGYSSTGGAVILTLTIVLGCVLSIAGTWVGVAGRRVVK
jgi:hypothetical protein